MLRWLYPAKPACSIESLPPDALRAIYNFLDIEAVMRASMVTKKLRDGANNESLWQTLYQRHFGPLVFREEAKLQCVAAWLYQHAEDCENPITAQLRYIKLLDFLSHHRNKPWAKFYFGVMHCHGRGVRTDEKQGKEQLLLSFNSGDYRAAIELVNLMMKDDKTRLYRSLYPLLYTCLQSAWNNGVIRAPLFLAYLCEIMLGHTLTEAVDWLRKVIAKHEPAAIKQLAHFARDNPDFHGLDIEHELKTLAATTSEDKKAFLAKIYYHLGLHYQSIGRDSEAQQQFFDAHCLHHFAASHILGSKYLVDAKTRESIQKRREDLRMARAYFAAGLQANHRKCTNGSFEATMLLLDSLQPTDTTELRLSYEDQLTEIKDCVRNGNMTAAILISYYNERNTPKKLLLADAEKIWLMQLSAQAGHAKSLASLINYHNETPSAFVAIALGIIHHFGILGCKSITPHSDYAARYFAGAESLQPGSIEKYLEAGENLGVIPNEIKDLLITYCQSDEPRPSSCYIS